jgi:tetratricopeptide (TPR) repeat protein
MSCLESLPALSACLSQPGADNALTLLAYLGSAIGAICVAIWAVFRWRKESARRSQNQSPAVTQNVTVQGGAATELALGKIIELYEGRLADQNAKITALNDELRMQVTAAIQSLPTDAAAADVKGVAQAQALLAQGETSGAEAIYREIADRRIASGSKEHAAAAHALVNLGALAFLHDTYKALAAFREATNLNPENHQAWLQLGHLLSRIGDFNQAITAYERVLTLGNRSADPAAQATAYGGLGVIRTKRGEIGEAEALFTRAVEITEASKNDLGMAYAYGNLARLYYAQKELEKAEATFFKVLKSVEALNDDSGAAITYINLSGIYLDRSELNLAEEYIEKSLAIYERLRDREGIASCYGNLGILYSKKGDKEKAVKAYKCALEINIAIGKKESIAIQYYNLAVFYSKNSEFALAREMGLKALGLFQDIEYADGIQDMKQFLNRLRKASDQDPSPAPTE